MASQVQDLRGLIVQGMAYRVKYRKVDSQGRIVKIWIAVRNLGAHTRNRGGVYPAGERCKNLCIAVLQTGFTKEESNHAGVCVEERPPGANGDNNYVSFKQFNKEKTHLSELLSSCFQDGYDDVMYGTLAHTHILLVLRAWLIEAKWDLPPDEEKRGYFLRCRG